MAHSSALGITPEIAKQFPWTTLNDLAAEKVGGQILHVTDEFFAPATWLLKEGRGDFYPGRFTENGQYMEGWETRRHNPKYDSCIIRLGLSGVIRGVDIDTNHFTGNHAPEASIDAVCLDNDPSIDEVLAAEWTEIVPRTKLEPGTPDKGHNFVAVNSEKRWTHLRLNNYPDGGIARLRVYGDVVPNWNLYDDDEVLNLLAIEHGARALSCSDAYFSKKDNLIMPAKGKNMGDGWETKRRRDGGYDWCILKFGWAGTIKRILIDTNWFKGNFPERCSIECCLLDEGEDPNTTTKWVEVLPKVPLQAHKEHYFVNLKSTGPFNHVRINIFPDGGISRLRIFGRRHFPTK